MKRLYGNEANGANGGIEAPTEDPSNVLRELSLNNGQAEDQDNMNIEDNSKSGGMEGESLDTVNESASERSSTEMGD